MRASKLEINLNNFIFFNKKSAFCSRYDYITFTIRY